MNIEIHPDGVVLITDCGDWKEAWRAYRAIHIDQLYANKLQISPIELPPMEYKIMAESLPTEAKVMKLLASVSDKLEEGHYVPKKVPKKEKLERAPIDYDEKVAHGIPKLRLHKVTAPVCILETNEVFASALCAGEAFGKRSNGAAIISAINRKKAWRGWHWEYATLTEYYTQFNIVEPRKAAAEKREKGFYKGNKDYTHTPPPRPAVRDPSSRKGVWNSGALPIRYKVTGEIFGSIKEVRDSFTMLYTSVLYEMRVNPSCNFEYATRKEYFDYIQMLYPDWEMPEGAS